MTELEAMIIYLADEVNGPAPEEARNTMSAVWIGPTSQLSSSQILRLFREERSEACVIEIKLLESIGPLSSAVAASRRFEIDGNFANVAEEIARYVAESGCREVAVVVDGKKPVLR